MSRQRTAGDALRRTLAAGAGIALLLAATPAAAVPECGNRTHQDACGAANPFPCCYWDGLTGNCTWWAWEKACREWGRDIPPRHNAHTWNEEAGSYPVRGEPCAGTVFVCEADDASGNTGWPCTSGEYGHVGWVLEVFPNGTIDISEQGCYWFDGTRERNFSYQNVRAGFIHYIYELGTDGCGPDCECDEDGAQQTRDCDGAPCGSQQRTCDGCLWGGWSDCTAGGDGCSPDAAEQRACAGGGDQQRVCDGECRWGAWSECPAADADADGDADHDAGDAESGSGDGDSDGDGNGDSDVDADTGADADSDSDADTDSDADSDSDADTDTDTDTGTGCQWDGDCPGTQICEDGRCTSAPSAGKGCGCGAGAAGMPWAGLLLVGLALLRRHRP